MLFNYIYITFLFIQIYIFLQLSQCNDINIIRLLNETNQNETNNTDISNETTFIEFYEETEKECSILLDCFNCTINPLCRWQRSNESCIPFYPFDGNYSIPELNESYSENDIIIINTFIKFIRKSCFLPYISYIENNNSDIYNKISVKYCGQHYITTKLDNYSREFLIKLNNISGMYGLPNILCEYVILSGPNRFDVNIKINESESTNFYLLYSENSFYFWDHINKSRAFSIFNTGRRANTFIYYGLKSFNSPPFQISFKVNKSDDSDSQTVGYILIALIILIFIVVVSSIIYIRYNSLLFNKSKNLDKKYINEEEETIKSKSDFNTNIFQELKRENIDYINKKVRSEQVVNKNDLKDTEEYKDNYIGNKIYSYDETNFGKLESLNNINGNNICCFDNEIIKNKNEIYLAKCGHKYHFECFNKLAQEAMNVNGQKIKCVACKRIIPP